MGQVEVADGSGLFDVREVQLLVAPLQQSLRLARMKEEKKWWLSGKDLEPEMRCLWTED